LSHPISIPSHLPEDAMTSAVAATVVLIAIITIAATRRRKRQ
jgi:hypothetical protein